MNGLVVGGALSAMGLLGFVLYTQHSAQVQDTNSVHTAELRCHFARDDEEMDRRWQDPPAKLQQDASAAQAECSEFQHKRATAEVRQVERNQPADSLQQAVGQMMTK
ncbi:hypothetical protein PQR34_44990 [Paraburkholderia sediminicola]|uniref:hypothetical protein n=1 Tax=Paraburkholderia sediminicola TaxID=458836 RepID=UPI0038BA7713